MRYQLPDPPEGHTFDGSIRKLLRQLILAHTDEVRTEAVRKHLKPYLARSIPDDADRKLEADVERIVRQTAYQYMGSNLTGMRAIPTVSWVLRTAEINEIALGSTNPYVVAWWRVNKIPGRLAGAVEELYVKTLAEMDQAAFEVAITLYTEANESPRERTTNSSMGDHTCFNNAVEMARRILD